VVSGAVAAGSAAADGVGGVTSANLALAASGGAIIDFHAINGAEAGSADDVADVAVGVFVAGVSVTDGAVETTGAITGVEGMPGSSVVVGGASRSGG
jgi:hypothetical protein